MKVCELGDDSYKVFINDEKIKNVDFYSEESLEVFIRDIIMQLKHRYNVILRGLYDVSIFMNEKVGALINIEKIEAFLMPQRDIDLRIKIIFDSKFYFKTKEFEIVKEFDNIYFYDDSYYIDASNIENFIRYVEFGDIIYDENLNFEEYGIKIIKNT
ncbi:MAG: hypothetical protein ACI4OG_03225 [Bacilli bacterium]